MLSLAELKPGEFVLEPSAGHGAIADVIRELHPTVNIIAIEVDPEKCAVLQQKHYCVHEADFLEGVHVETLRLYDCIIANPPFAWKQDVKHILHMWDLLKPNGRLVSVASNGVRTNSDQKSKMLQSLVAKHGKFIDINDTAFSNEGTNVRTCLVHLVKPL